MKIIPTLIAPAILALAACSGGEATDTADTDTDTATADATDAEAEAAAIDDREAPREEARIADRKLELELPEGIDKKRLGERTVEKIAVQTLLDRSRHSPGVIDGLGGGNTDRAIEYYREQHDLSAGTQIDDALIESLLETQGGDVFRHYTLTRADVRGPYEKLPEEMAQQAELDAMGYESAAEMLAEKFHMDIDFLKALNPNVDFAKAGTRINVVSRDDSAPQGDIAKIEVRKSEDMVVALAEDGTMIASYPATIGSGDFPSPSGRMKVTAVAPKPNYTFNPDELSYGSGETYVLPPGPNNPVGGTWIDLAKDGYGIHGSPDPQLIGKTASHGCVRLTNWDAEELGKKVKTGTPVVFV